MYGSLWVRKTICRTVAWSHLLPIDPKGNLKQLDQDKVIENSDQSKARDPKWHETIVNANIHMLEMSHDESVSYFKRMEILEKIKLTNRPDLTTLTVDNEHM
jgi:hypothetical protein